jgi:hypothetical protein
MKAFQLFKSANNFIIEHPLFMLYYAALTTISGFAAFLLKTLAVHEAESRFDLKNSPRDIWLNIIPDNVMYYIKNPNTFYVALMLIFFVALLSLGCVFFMQSLLNNKRSSIVSESVQAVYALLKAPWALCLLFIAASVQFLEMSKLLWLLNPDKYGVLAVTSLIFYVLLPFLGIIYLIIVIRCAYYQQLLYDKDYSFVSVFKVSWVYLKKSIYTLIGFSILTFIPVVLIYSLSSLVSAINPLAIEILLAITNIYVGLMWFVGDNIMYRSVKAQ